MGRKVIKMVDLQITPKQSSFAVQMEYATILSKSDLIPVAFRNKPSDILIAQEYGKELGLSPIKSLFEIYIVDGVPSISGKYLQQQILQAGWDVDFEVKGKVEDGTLEILMTGKKDDKTKTVSKTLKWAAQQGLAGKKNWTKDPIRMLQWRCVSEFANFYLLGSAGLYTKEEVLDMDMKPKIVNPVKIEAKKIEKENK
ncbi:MAG: hypothetical protein LBT99_03770 [Bifidobacteriaceae bacterium]|nr:hypothetical protein [Bifidobacteriaceae bacterium]